MTIAEPSTLVTDYALAVLAGILAWRLFRSRPAHDQDSVSLWASALAAIAAGSFAGGTYHGFGPFMPRDTSVGLWTLTTLVLGMASFLLLSSVIVASFSGRLRAGLLVAAGLKLALYTGWMLRHDAFIYVIYDSGSALLIVLALVVVGRVHLKEGGILYIVSGVLLTMGAAALQQSGFDFHRHFNHNDLQHVVQMGACWLLCRGGGLLSDDRASVEDFGPDRRLKRVGR
jgi:hypothetical protein